jgi:polyribonucleotide nucleotidyltransferase
LLGVSTALFISDIPWNGPVAGVRVAQMTADKQFVINPDNSAVIEPNLPIFDAFVSGSKDRINMIELGGLDAQEKDVVAGFKLAQTEINKLIAFQEQIQKEIGKPKAEVAIAEPDADIKAEVQAFLADK